MGTIIRFFVTWILLALVLFGLIGVSVGNFDISTWSQEARSGYSIIAGVGGFWFSVFVALVTE